MCIRVRGLFLFLSLVLIVSVSAGQTRGQDLRRQTRKSLLVFAGAANIPALTEAAKLYEKRYGVKVRLSFSGSGVALAQMKLARKGDVYLPGSDDYMDKAIKERIVDPKSVRIVCWLVPTIIVPKGNPKGIKSLKDLARPGLRVGIGTPGAVCLGDVAMEILEGARLKEAVSKNIVTQRKSCADLATQMKLGTVDAIIGWDVFTYWYPDTPMERLPIPPEVLRIRHVPAAVSVSAQDKREAQRFVNFLASPEGKGCYARWGYCVQKPALARGTKKQEQRERQ